MMRNAAFALLLVLAACGPSATSGKKAEEEKASGPGITLSAEEIKALGIITAEVRPATWRSQVMGYGLVVALDAVAQTDADFLTANAAAAQSQAAAARARSLATGEDAAVSQEVVETADAKAAADQAALLLARRKADAAFGLNAPWRSAQERVRVMDRLASGRTVLVRVTLPLGALRDAVPESITITRPGAVPKSWIAREIWAAPADPALPGRGFYALVDGSDLAQNEHVSAFVPSGPAETGVLVPAAALVIGESENWVYLKKDEEHFVRMPIDISKALADGYFVPRDGAMAAGARIVTRGAGLLLSRELNPGSGAEE